jgi:hypothetical protein
MSGCCSPLRPAPTDRPGRVDAETSAFAIEGGLIRALYVARNVDKLRPHRVVDRPSPPPVCLVASMDQRVTDRPAAERRGPRRPILGVTAQFAANAD